MERFDIASDVLSVISKNLAGEDYLEIQPSIVSYKIIYNQNSIGVMNFYNGIISSSFKLNNRQYEICLFNNQYILLEASNSINTSNFSCQVEKAFSNMHNNNNNNNNNAASESFLPVCIEFALEIDYYTRQTFNSDLDATNWALAIFAGVSQLYEAQTNASIYVQSIYIWNITDPYAAYVNDASGMLNALGSHWQNNNGGIARDLVHLLSKRDDTGTGGIAWLDVLCSTSYGYAFSSALSNDTTYTFPNPTYTWNLMVCSHEIGHNVGSSHTHDCVWNSDPTYGFVGPGIDDCGPSQGYGTDCGPTPSSGTIMSYCHLTSAGITLEFHNIVVSQALDPGIANASCLSICSTDGCTDPSAYNYVPSAVTDDGSCCYDAGCTDPNALNYNIVSCYNDGSCTYPIYGCTDPIATNYDSIAAADDGSCCYEDNLATLTMIDSWGDGWNGNYFVMTDVMTGTVAFNSTCIGYLTLESGCLPDGCYDITVDGGTWQSEVSWNLDDGTGAITSGFAPYAGQITVGTGSCAVNGCTDPAANNYDPAANTDDGSCIYTCTSAPYSENFDVGIGTITNNGWQLDAGGTPSANTGPSDDITGGGNYMYYETSSGYSPTVTLSTECLDVSVLSNPCLSFNYHMYGATMGILDVLVNGTVVWTLSGNQGNQWNEVQISLSAYSGTDVTITFAGAYGGSYTGDMAIDNISISECLFYGCTDPAACNFDASANVNDGSCILPDGCTDPSAYNYDASATCDDGSCVSLLLGCTDTSAFNYNSAVNTDDGSCVYTGCTDPAAL